MLEATQVSQASDSNAVGPSASVTVDNEAVPCHSFLATLCCPQPATIARKWKVTINRLHVGSEGQLCVAPSIPICYPLNSQQVREFPDEQLTVLAGFSISNGCLSYMGIVGDFWRKFSKE